MVDIVCTKFVKHFSQRIMKGAMLNIGISRKDYTRFDSYDVDARKFLEIEATKDEHGNYHGEYKEWSVSGEIYEHSFYKHGKLHGTAKSYFYSGKLFSQGEYENGLKNGEYKMWKESGELSFHALYKQGVEVVILFNSKGKGIGIYGK